MFGRKNEETDTTVQDTTIAQSPVGPRSDAARVATPVVTPPRRGSESSHTNRRDRNDTGTERRLTVGKGLSLSGEISACDSLVVEGKVEAKLSDGKLLEITESGQFRGTVEIENADIAGRYDGQLTVHGRLTVRSTGRISGMVCYGELEVNAGGQIIGEVQVVGENKAATNGGKGFKTAAKFTSLADEDDDRRVVVSA
ncbi:MAG: polymer-forming cytoskeletal protein [Alphaproteobacteria bacterium]|nr:polymer-forming cytoskeletal protein [Alphaproteobacteria bacterium]